MFPDISAGNLRMSVYISCTNNYFQNIGNEKKRYNIKMWQYLGIISKNSLNLKKKISSSYLVIYLLTFELLIS